MEDILKMKTLDTLGTLAVDAFFHLADLMWPNSKRKYAAYLQIGVGSLNKNNNQFRC